MLTHGLIERLSAMKLHGMATALEDIQTGENSTNLSLEDCFTLMIDHEEAVRASRALRKVPVTLFRYSGSFSFLGPNQRAVQLVEISAESVQ
jgi:hypothetical protein